MYQGAEIKKRPYKDKHYKEIEILNDYPPINYKTTQRDKSDKGENFWYFLLKIP